MIIHQVYNWVRVVQEKRCFVVVFWLRRGYIGARRWIVIYYPHVKACSNS